LAKKPIAKDASNMNKAKPPITCEPFSCQRDNLTIRGHVFRRETEVLPAAIVCHGFMANQSFVRRYAECLARLGWAAFAFDFCGGGLMSSSDGSPAEMSVLTEVEDLKSVIGYVKQRDDIDPGRISLMGCSQGGLVCALTAAELNTQIERLILFCPALCIPDHVRRGKALFARFDPDKVPPVISRFPMRLGDVYVKDIIGMNVYEEIRGYEGPVLIVHGTKDRIVPVSYSRRAKEVYKHCEYVEIGGAGHMFRGEHDRKAMEALERFMTGDSREGSRE
jgi:pimeloyl-ACP methyl ester carboxylesterase